MRARLGLVALSLVLAAPWIATAQRSRNGVIDGMVTDSTLAPLEGANVTVLRTALRVETGVSGRFRIVQMPPGQYLVIVRRIGFRPVSGIIEVIAGDTVRLSYALERARTFLDTTRITQNRATERHLPMLLEELEARRRNGIGQFMTQAEIERQNSPIATELVRTLHGLRIIPNETGGWIALGAHVIGNLVDGGTGPCYTQVFVDGIRMPVPANLDLLPSPKEIVGIELYDTMGTVPADYARYGVACGVLLVWTRRG
jgi:hypothetical protein